MTMALDINEQTARKCDHTVAFIFAPNIQSGPTLYEAGAFLRSAHMAAIFLMADASVAEEAVEAMRKLERKGRGSLIQAAEFDFSMVYGEDTARPGFQIEELPRDLLHVMKALAESVLDIYEYALVVDAARPVLDTQELEVLYHAEGVEEFDHAPYLLSRSYLGTL